MPLKKVVIELQLLKNNGYSMPGKDNINMAPADLRKEGSAYDLTLTIGTGSI
jgi:predicted ATPase with chaperone activity